MFLVKIVISDYSLAGLIGRIGDQWLVNVKQSWLATGWLATGQQWAVIAPLE